MPLQEASVSNLGVPHALTIRPYRCYPFPCNVFARLSLGFVLSMLLLLLGCYSSGNPSVRDEATVAKIQLGVTTKQDVRSLLGKPNSMSRSSGNLFMGKGFPFTPNMKVEIWNYTHMSVATDPATYIPIIGLFAGGATSNVTSVTIYFDDKDIVQYIQTSESESHSGMGGASGNQEKGDQIDDY